MRRVGGYHPHLTKKTITTKTIKNNKNKTKTLDPGGQATLSLRRRAMRMQEGITEQKFFERLLGKMGEILMRGVEWV